LVLVVLSAACSGLVSATTAPGPKGDGTKAVPKRTQAECKFKEMDGRTGEISVEVNGVVKKYPTTDSTKYVLGNDLPVAYATIVGAFQGETVVVTLETRDGKEVITEIRKKP